MGLYVYAQLVAVYLQLCIVTHVVVKHIQVTQGIAYLEQSVGSVYSHILTQAASSDGDD